MKFELLDSLSLPSDPAKVNDDAFAHEGASAVVTDGATSLGEPLLPGKSDAAWVAHFGCERLMAHVREGQAPEDALGKTLRDTEAEFAKLRRRAPNETYEIPCASMMFVSLAGSALRALWFGDCAGLVRNPGEQAEVLGEAIAKRAKEREHVTRLAASLGVDAAGTGVRETFLPALKRARNHMNSHPGSWLFSPDARAADHASSTSVAAPEGTIVLLATDGFLALACDYERYTPDSLLDAALARGLEPLGAELRVIEESDPAGKRFPRFKKSDDATAVLLRVAE